MEKNISFARIVHYYWPQVKKYRWSFFAVFIFYGIAAAISNGATPFLYRNLIDLISEETGNRLALAPELFRLLGLIIAAAVISNIFFRAADYCIVFSQSGILRELGNDAFTRVHRHSYRFFSNTFVGSLVASVRRYLDAFVSIYDNLAFNFWMHGVQLVVILTILLFTSLPVGVFFLVWSTLFIAFAVLLVRKQKIFDIAAAAQDSKVTGRIADVITNILNIKIFGTQRREYESFMTYTEHQERIRRTAWNFEILMFAFQGTMTVLLEIGGMYLAIRFWLAGALTTGTVVLIQLYFGRIFATLWDLGKSVSRFTRALSNASELVAVFDEESDILDPAEPQPVRIKAGEIVFDRVSFTYTDGAPVFENFSLSVKAGERVGLVGTSGAGKSTITKLLLRFVDIQKGAILIDGQDIRSLRQDDLRRNISYVPQEPILFHRSLRENIAYSKSDASEAEIIEAAKKAHAHEFISSFSNGYDTLVGERGVKLSGGERQRVAIARALLKDAPVVLLDEATSSLDSVSEKYIQEAFGELMKGRTTIVIAHRLSTIAQMDRIIVIEKGEIVEEGTHKELLEKSGVYHSFWTHQAGGFIE